MSERTSKNGPKGTDTAYNAYRVTSAGHETKILFAAGIWSAVGLLMQWRNTRGIGEVSFCLDADWANNLNGIARQHLDEAKSWCRRPSIGTMYRADTGWGLADAKFGSERDG